MHILFNKFHISNICHLHSLCSYDSVRIHVHVKLEKFKRRRSPSLHLAKEGDFARNHSATLILSINIQIPAEFLKMMRYSS